MFGGGRVGASPVEPVDVDPGRGSASTRPLRTLRVLVTRVPLRDAPSFHGVDGERHPEVVERVAAHGELELDVVPRQDGPVEVQLHQ